VENGLAPMGRIGKLVRRLAKGMAILDGKWVRRSGEIALEVIKNSDRFVAVMKDPDKEECDRVTLLAAFLWIYDGTPNSTTKITAAEMKTPFDNADQSTPEDLNKWKVS